MRYAIVEHGEVVNITHASEALVDNWIESSTANIGWCLVKGELVPRPLDKVDDLKERVLGGISEWRAAEEANEITVSAFGQIWDAGLKSLMRLDLALSIPVLPEGFFWTTADNKDLPVTVAQLRELRVFMAEAVAAQGFNIHARQRAMKAEISELNSEQLGAFVPGWVEPRF